MNAQMDDERALLACALDYAAEYLKSLPTRRAYPDERALAHLDIFNEPLPEGKGDPFAMLRMLHEVGGPATAPTMGGRYFGFVNGGALPAALAAKWIASAWDQNAALYVMSPAANKIEEVTEAWLIDLLALPTGTAAGFVSGTSTALAAGFVTARNSLLMRKGWDVSARGLFNAPELRVVVGEQAHGMVFKALAYIGLGRDRVELVPSDGQGRIIVGEMPPLDDDCLVIAQAGNVNSGAFDPLDEICDLAIKAGAWVHVDGAFGLWAAASRNKRHLLTGFDKADSWALDAHKTLNAPYDSGVLLCKDAAKLADAMQAGGSYLPFTEDQRDGSAFTPELARRARAIEIWAILKTIGRAGVGQLVDQLCDRTQVFAAALQGKGFTIKNDVVFNQILVTGESPAATKALLRNIQQGGQIWCGGTMWRGEPAIRISVCSFATTPEDVDLAVEAFCAARARG